MRDAAEPEPVAPTPSAPTAPTKAPSSVRTQLALATVSTVLSLGFAEIAVRALGITDPAFRRPDATLGWSPVPGASGQWTREGRAHVAITEHGFRGVDVAPDAPRRGFRIALVGDSYIEARQVALEASIGGRLATDTSACAARPIEVLSFGVSGYGTAQEYLLYRERIAAYRPDLVVLAFLTGNDVSDNTPGIPGVSSPRPYFAVGPNDTLVLDTSFRESAAFRGRADAPAWEAVLHHSQLVRALSSLGGHGNGSARGELGLSDEVYAEPTNDLWRDAWARTESLVRHYAQDVRADGARFAVVTLTNAIQIDPDAAVRERFRSDVHAVSLDYPDRRIADAGARDGYPVLTLLDPMLAHAEAHDEQLHGFPNTVMGTGHWNERGHELASRTLAQWLCERGLVAPLP